MTSAELCLKKDTVSVRVGNKKIACQKRLILCNLDEAYRIFKDKYPELKIGFSKFAELRPKYCVLAGSSGTHSVCVCTIHQNVKLMMHAVDIPVFRSSYKQLSLNSLATHKYWIASKENVKSVQMLMK